MRTEDDVRNALERIAAKAPDFTPILDNEPTVGSTRRRRLPLVIATVVATTAAAIGGPILVNHLRDTSAQPAGEQPVASWRSWVTFTAPAGMSVTRRVYEANRQIYELAEVGSSLTRSCLLTLHRNDNFDPGKIRASSPRIDINGLAGRLITTPYGESIAPLPAGYAMALGRKVRPSATVAWQPAKEVWALLSCWRQQRLGTRQIPEPSDSAGDTAVAVAVAKTVKATPQRLAAPFTISHWPDDLRAQRVLSGTARACWVAAGCPLIPSPLTASLSGDGHLFRVVFTDGDATTGAKPKQGWSEDPESKFAQAEALTSPIWRPHPLPGDDLDITFVWDGQSRTANLGPADLEIRDWKVWYITAPLEAVQGGSEPLVMPTMPAAEDALRMELNGVAITIRFLGGKADKAQLRKIAESLTFPKVPLNTAQWFDADIAIPR